MSMLSLPFIGKAFWIVVWILPLAGNAANVNTTPATMHSVPPNAQIVVYSSFPQERLDLNQFGGFWYQHGAGLRIETNGEATFLGRAYRWCSASVKPPCDSFQGNNIINGYKEHICFFHVFDSIAYGKVISGNYHAVGTMVTATLLPGDELSFNGFGTTGEGRSNLMCGPKAAVGACGA